MTGLTPDTRYLPPSALRSSDTSLMGSDRLAEWEMLMTDHVSEMLPVLQLISSKALGGRAGVEKVTGYPRFMIAQEMEMYKSKHKRNCTYRVFAVDTTIRMFSKCADSILDEFNYLLKQSVRVKSKKNHNFCNCTAIDVILVITEII